MRTHANTARVLGTLYSDFVTDLQRGKGITTLRSHVRLKSRRLHTSTLRARSRSESKTIPRRAVRIIIACTNFIASRRARPQPPARKAALKRNDLELARSYESSRAFARILSRGYALTYVRERTRARPYVRSRALRVCACVHTYAHTYARWGYVYAPDKRIIPSNVV